MAHTYLPVSNNPFRIPEDLMSHIASQTSFCRSIGRNYRINLDNGWILSVIDHGYGADEGLYEVALMDKNEHLIYNRLTHGDVIGYCNTTDISNIIRLVLDEKFDEPYWPEYYERSEDDV